MHVIAAIRLVLRWVFAAAIALWAGVSLWWTFTQTPEPARADAYVEMRRIYEPVRSELEGVETIGFVSHRDSEHGYLLRYYLAQSVLAPTVVRESADYEVVLASFADDWRLDEFLRDNGEYGERKRFAGGVALLERRRQ